MKKRFLVMLLTLCMVLAWVPMGASAETATSGTCGDNLTWVLDDQGTLTISGSGPMYDYIDNLFYGAPWSEQREDITSVILGDGVTTIGDYAFYLCNNLAAVTIGNSVTIIGEGAFDACGSLTGITIPDYVTTIDGYAFASCDNLAAVTIGNSVTTIGEYAFYFCDNLTRVAIPDSVATIGEYAFYHCNSLTSVMIPDSVITIGDNAFGSCSHLSSVTIGNGVTSIGDSAFWCCDELTDLTIGNSVITIGEMAFYDCYSLTDLTIPDSVTTIDESAFYDCDSLTDVIIPDSVTTIGQYAFANCDNLTSVTIPNRIESICDGIFTGCGSLTTVTVPDSVETIGEYAFYNCYSLASVVIPDSVTTILHSAFDACEDLTDVYYSGTQEQWNQISIGYDNDYLTNATIHFNSTGPQHDAGGVTRQSGANRFETAVMVADQLKQTLGVEEFDAIILANGYNFADALSGSYLASVKNAPILLTWNGSEKYDYLNELTVEYVKENLAEGGTVYILGGTSAVPESVDAMLEGYNIVRMDGANRFETNIMILEEAGVAEGQEILVCTSTNFADSLSGSAAGLPILLVWNEGGKLFDIQTEYLADISGKNSFCVLGGENAVSADLANVFSGYGETTRLAGANRFETSVMVAEKYFPEAESAVLAYAWDFPDGLCGGSLAYAMDAPLILTMNNYEAEAAEYIQGQGITSGIVLGGTGLISDDSVRAIFAMDAGE